MRLSLFPVVIVMLYAPAVATAFSDVSHATLHADAISYVQTQGIVQGYADGTFRPNTGINRAEFTKIIVEAVSSGASSSNCFPDVKSEWFAPYVCEAKAAGYIDGYPDGSFRPGNSISFVEGAKIIVNAFGKDTPQGDGQWYAPFVLSLEEAKAIPQDIDSLSQPLTRGQMAEIIYRLHANKTDLAYKTYVQLGGNITVQNVSSSSRSSTSSKSAQKTLNNLPYTLPISANWQQEWDVRDIEGTAESMENITVIEENGKFPSFFRVQLPAKSGSRYLWKHLQKPIGGFGAWVNPKIQPQKELYVTYYVRFPKDFDFSTGGWLPGLFTGISNNRVEEDTGAVDLHWTEDAEIVVTGRFIDSTEHKGFIKNPTKLVADGEWHKIEMYVNLQTHVSKRNGTIMLWIDGEEVIKNNNILFSNRTDDAWDAVIFGSGLDGIVANKLSPKDMHVDIAGITISNKRIK